jgi:hypothetical protein
MSVAKFPVTLRALAPATDHDTWEDINKLAAMPDVTLPGHGSVTEVPAPLWVAWRRLHSASDLILDRLIFPL